MDNRHSDVGRENKDWMIDVAGGRSLWRLWDPASLHPHPSDSHLASSSLVPNLPLLCRHTLLPSTPYNASPSSSSCLLCGLIDGRTLTTYPPSISLSWSWKPQPPPPTPPPTLTLLCSLFIMFPFGSTASESMDEFTARLNSLPKGTWTMWMCTWIEEMQCKKGGRKSVTDWLTDILNNWLVETPGVKVRELDHRNEQEQTVI